MHRAAALRLARHLRAPGYACACPGTGRAGGHASILSSRRLNPSSRDKVIVRDYPLLRDDLTALMADRSTPLVLIKTNVCRLLEPKLRQDGFNVLNRGRVIYFPSTGRQKEFQRQFSKVLQS
jgi:hypothetical protein